MNKSFPPHDPAIPLKNSINSSINQTSNQNSNSTSNRNKNVINNNREVSALRAASLTYVNNNGISPQISDFVNNTVQNAVLNMSNIQLKHAAEISALNKKLDGILSELSKMNSHKVSSCSPRETSHKTISTQVEEELIAETAEYEQIHRNVTMPQIVNAFNSCLAAHEKAKSKKKRVQFHGNDYDDDEDSDDSYRSHSYQNRPNHRPQNYRLPQNKAQYRANYFQNGYGRKKNNNNRNNNKNNKPNNGNKSNQKN